MAWTGLMAMAGNSSGIMAPALHVFVMECSFLIKIV
jgi:hypothetical protein